MTAAAAAQGHWLLDPEVHFLNHGSFGACPEPILAEQDRWRRLIEREPVAFMVGQLEPALDTARAAVAQFLGADAEDVAFVPNATTGVNAVVLSMPLAAGDQLLVTDHVYNACKNALQLAADRAGAEVVTVPVPFPLADGQQVVDRVLAAVTPRTRLAMLDHITSPTGLVMPIEALVAALAERGVDTLVDGAHAPGMVPLDLNSLGAAYYTGNCHKWLCAPKGAAFLWTRRDLQDQVRPVTISHAANGKRSDRSRYLCEFDWPGTHDPSPFLALPTAIEFLRGLLPGGFQALREHNRTTVLRARDQLCARLGIEPPAPDAMIGSLAAVPLPDIRDAAPASWQYVDPLGQKLQQHYRIQVPVFPWPAPPRRLLRVSAQIYNTTADYDALDRALATELAEV